MADVNIYSTKIFPSTIEGKSIEIATDSDAECSICGEVDIVGKTRFGKFERDGDGVVFDWYYVCRGCAVEIRTFLSNLKEDKASY